MKNNLATLGIKIDASEVKEATDALKKLTDAGERALTVIRELQKTLAKE